MGYNWIMDRLGLAIPRSLTLITKKSSRFHHLIGLIASQEPGVSLFVIRLLVKALVGIDPCTRAGIHTSGRILLSREMPDAALSDVVRGWMSNCEQQHILCGSQPGMRMRTGEELLDYKLAISRPEQPPPPSTNGRAARLNDLGAFPNSHSDPITAI